MQIYIKTLGVRKQPFNFEFESTVLEVKQALQEKEGIQLDQIRFLIASAILAFSVSILNIVFDVLYF